MFSALSKTSEFEVRRDDGTDEKGSTRTSFLSSGSGPLSIESPPKRALPENKVSRPTDID